MTESSKNVHAVMVLMIRTSNTVRALTTVVQAGDVVEGVGAIRAEGWLHGCLGAVGVGRALERHAAVPDAIVTGRAWDAGVGGSGRLVGPCHT